jgi:signal transduction histidine kinase
LVGRIGVAHGLRRAVGRTTKGTAMSVDAVTENSYRMRLIQKESITSTDIVQKNHVLVVDDENGPRQALRMLLKESYAVHIAENTADALEALISYPIGLVVSDIRMPGTTGVELLKSIKEQNKDIQVIMMTGYGELETAMKSVQYGAFAYLEKPFDSQNMLQTVQAGYAKYAQERERRALEDLALEASRFETLGRLVSGTMHDLATPLTVLNSHLEMIANKPDRDDIPKRVETMRSQVKYCAEIARNTMDFLRHEKGADGTLQINDVVQSCVSIGSPYFRETSTACSTDLASELPMVMGESVLLRQSLMNILNNACQAMQNHVGERKVSVRTFLDDDSVCVMIEDNGPGIPESIRGRVFEMFYSTKGSEGTGLGLGVVQSVMNRCGGTIELMEGTAGKGACFRLTFPIMKMG